MGQLCSYARNWVVSRVCVCVVDVSIWMPFSNTNHCEVVLADTSTFQSQQQSLFLLFNKCPEDVADLSISMRLNNVSTFYMK